MPIRALPTSSAWKGDFLGSLSRQYELLGLAPPQVSGSMSEAQARPELLLFFGDQRWAPDPLLQAELASYARGVSYLLPVIDDVTHAITRLPDELREFNAFARARHGMSWTDALVDEVLALTWQRRSKRRIFISYRRTDSEGVARQLYDRYTKLSFDVFLDDVSIQHGVNFQAELRRWLDDADAVLLLISPEIASSRWVREEVELACTRRIGLLGIVWPEARFGAAGEPAAAAQVPPIGNFGSARPRRIRRRSRVIWRRPRRRCSMRRRCRTSITCCSPGAPRPLPHGFETSSTSPEAGWRPSSSSSRPARADHRYRRSPRIASRDAGGDVSTFRSVRGAVRRRHGWFV